MFLLPLLWCSRSLLFAERVPFAFRGKENAESSRSTIVLNINLSQLVGGIFKLFLNRGGVFSKIHTPTPYRKKAEQRRKEEEQRKKRRRRKEDEKKTALEG